MKSSATSSELLTGAVSGPESGSPGTPDTSMVAPAGTSIGSDNQYRRGHSGRMPRSRRSAVRLPPDDTASTAIDAYALSTDGRTATTRPARSNVAVNFDGEPMTVPASGPAIDDDSISLGSGDVPAK